MATRTKPNWKVLDRLLPIFEKEGWSHAQIAEDWGISLATLEGHLDRGGESMGGKPEVYVDWQRFDELQAQGLPVTRISDEMGIKLFTLHRHIKRRKKAHQSTPEAHQDIPEAHQSTPEDPELWTVHPGTPERSDLTETVVKPYAEHLSTPEPTELLSDDQYTQEHLGTLLDADHIEAHHGTLEGHQEVMEDISQSVPDAPHIGIDETDQSTPEHPSTPVVHPELSVDDSSTVHSGVPARQDHLISTPMVHPGTPSEEDWELSTPMGTPGQTQKKTYVFDVQHIALIDEYARVHRMELKDVIYLMCEEFFQRR